MTQEQINKGCRNYMEWIANIASNRTIDYDVAEYYGLDIVDFTEDDLKMLKNGYELFEKADESVKEFENIVLSRRKDI